MKHENENAANLHTGLKRREFMAMLAGCNAGMLPLRAKHGAGTRPNARNASMRWPPLPAKISSSTRAEFSPHGKEFLKITDHTRFIFCLIQFRFYFFKYILNTV